jgi:hypothetical protein
MGGEPQHDAGGHHDGDGKADYRAHTPTSNGDGLKHGAHGRAHGTALGLGSSAAGSDQNG